MIFVKDFGDIDEIIFMILKTFCIVELILLLYLLEKMLMYGISCLRISCGYWKVPTFVPIVGPSRLEYCISVSPSMVFGAKAWLSGSKVAFESP
jgi:hypothetical protein